MVGLSEPTNEGKSINSDFHKHLHTTSSKNLLLVLVMTFIVMLGEIIIGYAIESLSLIADGGHMINDVLALFIALVAIRIGRKEQSHQFTFGFKRVEVLSGLINGISLLIIASYILIEALNRIVDSYTPKITGSVMFLTAMIGLIVNIIGLRMLKGHSHNSINVEGAYQHILADLLGSIAAVLSSLSIILFRAYWTDLVVSIIISIVIFKSGLTISSKAIRIILEASPDNKDVNQILEELMATPGVIDVHDLHCWTLTSGTDLITGHITIEQAQNSHDVLASLVEIAKNHGYDHPTFQIELDSCVEVGDCYPFSNVEKKR